MRNRRIFHLSIATILFLFGCGNNHHSSTKKNSGLVDTTSDSDTVVPDSGVKNPLPDILVNSLEDVENPPAGTVTLRSALASAASGQSIRFDVGLDGGVIELSILGEEHTMLKGEIMGMRTEPSGPVSYLVGYFERDYGKSALYAKKNLIIDATTLPSGITLAWTGGASSPARVLAVYGDLTMKNVAITGGHSVAEDISTGDPEDQPWTLARGGALAVWGVARLVNCTLYDNHCVGDFGSSRDRGAYGGGVYADCLDLVNCIVSGNTVTGGGAAGGGVYSEGGAEELCPVSSIVQSSITGNRIQGLNAYGGGVFSNGGGIGHLKVLKLTNCTIAENLAEPAPGLPPAMLKRGYWRGGGVYMSNGYLEIYGCTVTENSVYGYPRTDALGKINLAGGIAATIGNAHAAEEMVIGQSIIAGNQVYALNAADGSATPYNQDIFTGSLMHFKSRGYNRFGAIDFSQILVPVGETDWESLCRKHYPKVGDADGVDAADVLDMVSGITFSDSIASAGVDAPDPVVLHYLPRGSALDQVPVSAYDIEEIYAEYRLEFGANDFLEIALNRIENHYGLQNFADNFITNFESYLQSVDTNSAEPGLQPYTDPSNNPILTIADTQWFGPAETWPKELPNYPYIEFWHRLDESLRAENIPGMGPELLGDTVWSALFSSGPLVENRNIVMEMISKRSKANPCAVDQLGTLRPRTSPGDIGAIEAP